MFYSDGDINRSPKNRDSNESIGNYAQTFQGAGDIKDTVIFDEDEPAYRWVQSDTWVDLEDNL